MDRESVMRKIAKCLALANDTRGDAATAAVALAQAQKLMERHGVTEQEMGAYGFTQEKIQTAIQCGKALPIVLAKVVTLIMHSFGVEAVTSREIRKTDYNWSITYWGPEHRVMLAKYAHEVVTRAVDRAWATYIRENPHRKGAHGARAGFYIGWINEVWEKVSEFGMSDEEKAGTALAKSQHYGYQLKKGEVSKQGVRRLEMGAGAAAAEGFSLHVPVTGAERLKIGN